MPLTFHLKSLSCCWPSKQLYCFCFMSHTPVVSCSLLHAVTQVLNYIPFLKPIVRTEAAPLNDDAVLIFSVI